MIAAVCRWLGAVLGPLSIALAVGGGAQAVEFKTITIKVGYGPGGGFDHLDRPEGVAFQKVKGFGKAAYAKLIKYIDDEDTAIAIGAVAALNALTGRDSALPKGVTKAKIKAEWEEWLKNEGAAPK